MFKPVESADIVGLSRFMEIWMRTVFFSHVSSLHSRSNCLVLLRLNGQRAATAEPAVLLCLALLPLLTSRHLKLSLRHLLPVRYDFWFYGLASLLLLAFVTIINSCRWRDTDYGFGTDCVFFHVHLTLLFGKSGSRLVLHSVSSS